MHNNKHVKRKSKIKERGTNITVVSSSDNTLKFEIEGQPYGNENNKPRK